MRARKRGDGHWGIQEHKEHQGDGEWNRAGLDGRDLVAVRAGKLAVGR